MTEEVSRVIDEVLAKKEKEKQIKSKILQEVIDNEIEKIEENTKAHLFYDIDFLLSKRFYKQVQDLSQYVENGIISMQAVYIYNILYNKLRADRALQIKYNRDLQEFVEVSKSELMQKTNTKWNKTMDKYLVELESAKLIKIENNGPKRTRFYLCLF
ncbi:hypothetical protein [Streptobacillus moniliformis]|uniref:hypothetical protein n=1 Tax=Streptobacillus moniliformis TaxID=34105 RepID=UPI0007E31C4C|nr:hypothetical protein [Streptobacillus moniliformis]